MLSWGWGSNFSNLQQVKGDFSIFGSKSSFSAGVGAINLSFGGGGGGQILGTFFF